MAGGRPTKYKPEYNEQVIKLCYLGATDQQIADFFNVSKATINTWKKEYPQFLDSLKEGKENADAVIAQSLFHRAKGFSHPDTHISNYQGDITKTEITKQYAPDVTACIFWLKNRSPNWSDRKEVRLDAEVTDASQYSNTERLTRLVDFLGLPESEKVGRISEERNSDMGASKRATKSRTKH